MRKLDNGIMRKSANLLMLKYNNAKIKNLKT